MLQQSKDWPSYFQWLPLPNKTQINEKKSHQASVLYNRRNKHQFGKDIEHLDSEETVVWRLNRYPRNCASCLINRELKPQWRRRLQKGHFKSEGACFKLYRAYSKSFNSSNLGNFLWSWILKDCIDVQEKNKKVVALCRFTSSTKKELRHFHSVVVQ